MSFPSLADGALESLDMSGVLVISTQAQTSGAIVRGDPQIGWGAVTSLEGPYVLDDSPGAKRVPSPGGGTVEVDAMLYVNAQGPGLPGGALSKGDRVLYRGLTFYVEARGDWSELAEVLAVGLKARRQPGA